jgi:serine/threonine-protein kinase
MMPASAGFSLGAYQMEQPVGAGTLGVVFRARDTRNNQKVAVKVFTPGRIGQQARARVRQTAMRLMEISHPNVASVFDFGSHGEIDYLVMEYVFGTTLDRVLQGRPLESSQAIAIAAQLASGLAAGHGAGVVHGDIKPSNLRITPDGRLAIVDFGLATFAWPDRKGTPTPSELLLATAGTLQYTAPERLLGASSDERTDIYSAGAVLYEMACGRPLASDRQPIRLIHSRLHGRAPEPSAVNPWVHPAVEGVILAALDRDPRRRYLSASDMAEALLSLQQAGLGAAPGPDARCC